MSTEKATKSAPNVATTDPYERLMAELAGLDSAEEAAAEARRLRDLPEIVRLKKEHGADMQWAETAAGVFAWKRIPQAGYVFWRKRVFADHGDVAKNADEKAGAQATLMRPLILWPVGSDLEERLAAFPGVLDTIAGEAITAATAVAAQRVGK